MTDFVNLSEATQCERALRFGLEFVTKAREASMEHTAPMTMRAMPALIRECRPTGR